jgi:DNA-binding beta-propeller fold protein YncE
VANTSSESISEYSILPDGTLGSVGTVSVAGSNLKAITVDPSGRYVYVVNNGGTPLVRAYSIGTGGALTLIGSVASGGVSMGIAVEPTGHYVYVTNNTANTVSAFSIGSGGLLSAIGTAATGHQPSAITVDRTGSYVYVVNSTDQTVQGFNIGSGGVLTSFTSPSINGACGIATAY